MCWLQSILSLQYRWWKVPEPSSFRLSEVSPSRPLNGAAAPWGGGGWRDEGILGRGWTPPYRAHRMHHLNPQLAQPCVPRLNISGPLHCSKTSTHRHNTIPGSTHWRALFGLDKFYMGNWFFTGATRRLCIFLSRLEVLEYFSVLLWEIFSPKYLLVWSF